jgi:hypothetical protein
MARSRKIGPRRVELRMAPPKHAERRHARPGSGIKKARGVMVPKTQRRSPKSLTLRRARAGGGR